MQGVVALALEKGGLDDAIDLTGFGLDLERADAVAAVFDPIIAARGEADVSSGIDRAAVAGEELDGGLGGAFAKTSRRFLRSPPVTESDVAATHDEFAGLTGREPPPLAIDGVDFGVGEGPADRVGMFGKLRWQQDGDPLALREAVHDEDLEPGEETLQFLDVGERQPLAGVGDGAQPRQIERPAPPQGNERGVDRGHAGQHGDARLPEDARQSRPDLLGIAKVELRPGLGREENLVETVIEGEGQEAADEIVGTVAETLLDRPDDIGDVVVREGDAARGAGAARGEDETGGIDVNAGPSALEGRVGQRFRPGSVRQRHHPGLARIDPLEIGRGHLIDDDHRGPGLGKDRGEALGTQFRIQDDEDPSREGDSEQGRGELAAILDMDGDAVAAGNAGRAEETGKTPRFVRGRRIGQRATEPILEERSRRIHFRRGPQQPRDTPAPLPRRDLRGI